MKRVHVGEYVFLDCLDGINGPAVVLDDQGEETVKYKLKLLSDGTVLRVFDFEIIGLSDNDQRSTPSWWQQPESLRVQKLDSRVETLFHIRQVQKMLGWVVEQLLSRAAVHDDSKLKTPEVEVFDEFTCKLKGMTYGSDAYKACLTAMKPALDHHYANNSHHPEHYPNGIQGMTLIDLVEMWCDWYAASMRHADGNIRRSVEMNQGRFKYSDDLKQIMLNTIDLFSPQKIAA